MNSYAHKIRIIHLNLFDFWNSQSKNDLSDLFNLERHLWVLGCGDLIVGLVGLLIWPGEFKFKVIVNQRNRDAEHDFRECSSCTDAFAAAEGTECKRVSGCAVRSFKPFGLRVEAIGVEFARVNPLDGIVQDGVHVNDECCFVFLEVDTADFYILVEVVRHRAGS